jgi:hypothetical protein
MRQAPFVTNEKPTPLISTLRRGWQQVVHWGQLNPAPRGIYYGVYAIFFYGFLFFPSSKSHNNFFYVTLLLPSLIILKHLYPTFLKSNVFKLTISYLAYLVLTGFWGVNVTFENVAVQIKHLLYVLAFITASIVVEVCYPEKRERLLPTMAGIAAVVFLVNTIWWYQSHSFPAERLFDIWGRMDNPIFAGCIAGMASLVLIDILQKKVGAGIRLAAGFAFTIHLTFIMLSQSRTALVALIPAILVLLIPHIRRHSRLLIITTALFLGMGFIFQDALIAGFNRGSVRMDIWRATLEKAVTHLWWGQGYFCDTFALHIEELNYDAPHAHSVYLATLRDGGVIGLALLVGAVSVATYQAWRQSQAAKHYLTLSLMIYGLTAVFFDTDRLIDNPEESWIFFLYPLSRVIAHDLTQADRFSLAQQ